MNEQNRLHKWFWKRELDDIRAETVKETKLGNIIELDRKYNEVFDMKYSENEI